MTVSSELWHESRPSASFWNIPLYKALPMVHFTGKIAYYVGQDAFLEAFARAYSIVAAKATDWRDLVPSMP